MSSPIFEVFDGVQTPDVIEVLQGPPGVPGPMGPQGPQGPVGPAGQGKVESVNGQTGPLVVLTAPDVGALPFDATILGGTY